MTYARLIRNLLAAATAAVAMTVAPGPAHADLVYVDLDWNAPQGVSDISCHYIEGLYQCSISAAATISQCDSVGIPGACTVGLDGVVFPAPYSSCNAGTGEGTLTVSAEGLAPVYTEPVDLTFHSGSYAGEGSFGAPQGPFPAAGTFGVTPCNGSTYFTGHIQVPVPKVDPKPICPTVVQCPPATPPPAAPKPVG